MLMESPFIFDVKSVMTLFILSNKLWQSRSVAYFCGMQKMKHTKRNKKRS